MAKIRNTGIPNVFGDGYEQEVELDNGKKYRIRNSGVPNVFGEGYEKEIEEVKSYSTSNYDTELSTKDILILIFLGGPIFLFGLALLIGVFAIPIMTIINL